MKKRIQDIINEAFKLESKELSLSEKELISIPKELSQESGVQSIYLQNNKIKKLENLEGLVKAIRLNIYKNQIEKIENLSELENLKRINLSGNQIESLEKDSLPPNLLRIDLSNNKITKVLKNSLPPHLEELDLRKNNLSSIPKALLDSNLTIYLEEPDNGEKGIYVAGNPFNKTTLKKFKSNKYNPSSKPIPINVPPDPDPIKILKKWKDNEIYFSYAWNDEDDQENTQEQIVDDLFATLDSTGLTIVRDKDHLVYAESITRFMQDLSKSKLIITFISDKYFKSPFCMFELYEIARDSKWEKEEFLRRVLPIPIENLNFIDIKVRNKYSDYWNNKEEKMNAYIKKRLDNLPEDQFNDLVTFQKIKAKCGELMGWLKEVNYSQFEDIKNGNFKPVIEAIQERLAKMEEVIL